jgi:apolipoprotein N-acyltransferase
MPGGNWSKATFFAIFWVIAELLRSYCFTGFPWNLLGYVWTTSNEMMQLASVIGTYGLSFVAIIIVTCLFPYLKSKQKVDIFIGAGLSLGLLSGIYGFGHYRLSHAEAGDLTNINLRIVQANIAQEIKWDRNLRYDNLMQYVKLSQVPAIHSDYHIIWPESAIPFLINEEAVRALIKPAIAPGKLLLTGSIRTEQNLCYNSISVIDDQGLIVTHYDKSHLVPFGEYVPLRYMLPSYINKITYGDNDFSAGKKQGTLNVGHDLPALSPIICYEVIFPQQLTSRKKAQWILNTTNDAWYGNSSGPYQHFNMARVRAVENGMPLVRAAGTGISGIIDSYGRVRQSLGLNERGVIDGKLPKALSSPTIYSIYGDKIILLLMLVIGGVHIAKDFAKK